MNSNEANSFEMCLGAIARDLKRYKTKKPDELLTQFINEKLKVALSRYDTETDTTTDFLSEAGDIRVMKAITKIQKKADKALLEEMLEEDGGDIKND